VEENAHIIATFGGHVKESAIFFTYHREMQRRALIVTEVPPCGRLTRLCAASVSEIYSAFA
jgi:hypothetical protein